jgi:hypothetical protein
METGCGLDDFGQSSSPANDNHFLFFTASKADMVLAKFLSNLYHGIFLRV